MLKVKDFYKDRNEICKIHDFHILEFSFLLLCVQFRFTKVVFLENQENITLQTGSDTNKIFG